MRADRLVATLLLMQNRGRVTAAEIATELDVSVATARRDLEALSSAGVPVYPQSGRGGGWSLVGGARTDLTGLSASEAQALFLLVGPAAAASEDARAAMRKLVRALPHTFRAAAQAAAEATMVDSAGWGERRRSRPAEVTALQAAVVSRQQVRLTYRAGGDSTTVRMIDPWGLVEKDGSWYLLAGTERGQRTFRVDRIVEAEVTDRPAQRPVDFDLAAAWEAVVVDMEGRRSKTWATLLTDRQFVPILHDQFGRHCEVVAELDDGRSKVRLGAPTPLDIARNLAGWGAAVEVLEPSDVRAELDRIGEELVNGTKNGT